MLIGLVAPTRATPPGRDTVPTGPSEAVRPLDPSFARALRAGEISTAHELALRFLRAAGRDPAAYATSLDELAQRLRSCLPAPPPTHPRERCRCLARFLFEVEGFHSDADLTSLSNLYPDAILSNRRGYCLGLSLVIVALGERIGWPLHAVGAPRHTFVCHPRQGTQPAANLETTQAGACHEDDWYRQRFSRSSSASVIPTRLSLRQLGAHLLNNHGYALLEAGIAGAAPQFEAAVTIDPGLVEGWINRGVAEARGGRFARALMHFDRALELWPHDPDVRRNRIHSLVALKRLGAAVTDLTRLIAERPESPANRTLAQEIRSQLDPEAQWREVQLLTFLLTASPPGSTPRPGVRGQYFAGTSFDRLVVERIDRELNFRWGWGAPAPGLPRDRFSVQWDGLLRVEQADEFTFYVSCSDGVRIRVDGRLVVDQWHRANDTFASGRISLLAGVHELEVEYFESIGDAGIMVLLGSARRDAMVDLPAHLHTPPDRQSSSR